MFNKNLGLKLYIFSTVPNFPGEKICKNRTIVFPIFLLCKNFAKLKIKYSFKMLEILLKVFKNRLKNINNISAMVDEFRF